MNPALRAAVETALAQSGAADPVLRAWQPISGGDISNAGRIQTAQGEYFIKWQVNPPAGFFEAEAAGLRALAAAGARSPQVIAVGCAGPQSFLLLAWIDASPRKDDSAAETLGRDLAALHREPGPYYGFSADNYIGRLPQPNLASASWISFYGEQRLAAQRKIAVQRGRLPTERARRLDRLIDSLGDWIDERALQPSLIHGDLWAGNWLVSKSGDPLLIDPAVCYADREMDLAMARLFGGFPARFFTAYAEACPLLPGWEARVDLYQLYYLLVHLNLFGEGYGAAVDAALLRLLR